MPVVDGRSPVSRLDREGLHSGDWTVRVGEQRAPLREPVDVRRLHLRMAAEAADPVVLVVDGDEQDVGPPGAGRLRTVPPCEKQTIANADRQSRITGFLTAGLVLGRSRWFACSGAGTRLAAALRRL